MLEFPLGGWPAHWNFTALNDLIFVSEYGTKNGASRHIYRSNDDGRTWQTVYDPPPVNGYHCHQILGDPWNGCVYQAYGDNPQEGVLCSPDGGETWTKLDDFHLPTSGIARSDAVYWGSDGWGRNRVARYERDTGRWTHPLRPWIEYSYGQTGTCNVYTMLDHQGVMYAPFAWKANEMWASADGLHWAFCWAGDQSERGLWFLVGELGGWIHASYGYGPPIPDPPHGYMTFRPTQVATLTGLRLEPPCDNLLLSAQASSAEEGLEGWDKSSVTTLEWDTSRSFHGQASVKCDNMNLGSAFVVKCPPLSRSLPVGSAARARIHVTGDAAVLSFRVHDERNNKWGPRTLFSPDCEWANVLSHYTVEAANNRLRLVVEGWVERAGNTSVWLDGHQITDSQTGQTWQLGGAPRSGELLKARVPFPGEWTDFLCYRPDFRSEDFHPSRRTIKAWVRDADHYARLVFDPCGDCLRLEEVVAGQSRELSHSDALLFRPGWTLRVGLRNAVDASELRICIGSERHAVIGDPVSVQPTEVWIGSSPAKYDQAPGLYSLSRTFGTALGNDDFERELLYLPSRHLAGDCNCDGTVNFGDINPFVLALTDPAGYVAAYPACSLENADINEDGKLDFGDINPFVSLLTGS